MSFGYSLATGDINGDGRDDVIVGAPRPDVTPGKALAFLGGGGFGRQPDAILKDPDVGSPVGFGYFLAAGDVNGDNKDEAIVGKPLGGGKVFVFPGSADSLGAPIAVLQDPEHKGGSLLGYPVAVGDVNGDGYEDVIVGAPYSDVDGLDAAGFVRGLVHLPCGPVQVSWKNSQDLPPRPLRLIRAADRGAPRTPRLARDLRQ